MKSLLKKDTQWSIVLAKDSHRASLEITAVKKDRVEFVIYKFPKVTFALPKEKFLEHFELYQ